jgi:hypothetical protein
MKPINMLPALPALFCASILAATPYHPSTNRVLLIERSSTEVSGGKATLSIGPLKRTGNIYAGDYKVKVAPWFFKGEKGTLAMVVSDESLALAADGNPVEITGTATTNNRKREVRRIDVIATPSDKDRGALKVWFVAAERKMVFNTSYHFLDR